MVAVPVRQNRRGRVPKINKEWGEGAGHSLYTGILFVVWPIQQNI